MHEAERLVTMILYLLVLCSTILQEIEEEMYFEVSRASSVSQNVMGDILYGIEAISLIVKIQKPLQQSESLANPNPSDKIRGRRLRQSDLVSFKSE
jgi:hypothetical protein